MGRRNARGEDVRERERENRPGGNLRARTSEDICGPTRRRETENERKIGYLIRRK